MIDELLTELSDSGWLLNNLYQVDGGLWRANLRLPDGQGDWFTTWAEGSTAYDALIESFSLTGAAEFSHTPETKATVSKSPMASLLSRLGLAKPSQKIERRI